ncbi:MAG: prolyl oligopeptidase family serine peptidase [Ignavibacteria bacterium]|jgi:prolyl oligopeptidase|nr:prolyl oligopeptidase family serine peptidase [Ignavibacteria bacterium]
MRNKIIIATIITILSFHSIAAMEKFNPPKTPAIPVIDTLFGFHLIDNYRWLEDKKDPKVSEWSHSQHQYTLDYINKNFKQYSGMKEEIRKIYDRDIVSSPFFKHDREFFYKKMRGEQQSKLYTRIGKKEVLLFDPLKKDPTGKSAITSFELTKNADKAAIGLQYQGNEVNTFYVIDTKTGKELYEPITGLSDWAWTQDGKAAYIVERNREMLENQIPLIVYYHKLGDAHDKDIKLMQPENVKNFASIYDDDDEPYTIVSEADFWSNTLYIMPLGHSNLPQKKMIFSSKEFKANPEIRKDKIYFFTNYNAPNWKIMVADINHPEQENWKDFYPEKDTKLTGYVFTSDYFIAYYRKDVLAKADVYDLNGKFIKQLEMPETADLNGMSYHKLTNTVYASFSSANAPSKIYKLDGKTLEWKFFWQDSIDADTKDIITEQLFATSPDGSRVPFFIMYKKGMKLDGNNPVLMYGYGGFNTINKPSFLNHWLSFVNRGGIYIISCIRGGGEYGEKWHQEGMLHKKQNTIDDFIAICEYLIDNKYTNPQRLAIRGGSNGGILIGGMALQRPDLFKAAVCSVPLLDMVRYHKFLMGPYWIPEYGSSENKDDLLYILKYSPYQNIKECMSVPSMLIKAGENDARVDPLHAKKFAASLQNLKGQTEPIFLYIDFESGHGSGQSIDQMIDNLEFELRYIMSSIGM